MRSLLARFLRIVFIFIALILVVPVEFLRTIDGEDPCYQHVDEQRKRLPTRLDIANMRNIANAITSISWQVAPIHDTAPTHCAYHGPNQGLNAPEYWPGDVQPAPLEYGVPYKWDGADNACDFGCLHDPRNCSEYSHPEQCSNSVKLSPTENPRSAGLHNLLREEDQACTTGIDCSGLVSVAWGLPWKLGTPNSSESDNWCSLSFAAHEVTRITVKHLEVPAIDQSFWKKLQPGDALVMPGHVVLVDYPIGGELGSSGACVWEASGHRKVKIGDRMIYAEETAHRVTINETWLTQKKNQQDYDLTVFRFKGQIDGLNQNLSSDEVPCGRVEQTSH
jgi:cell wall-associated NlpC family hydrolase